jgi:hypothetical protein
VSTGALCPGVKLPGRDGDHLPPTRAKVKKTWIYTPTPPYACMAVFNYLSTGETLAFYVKYFFIVLAMHSDDDQ